MLRLVTKADLERLVLEAVQESLTLDYKDARSLGKTSPERNELCKDVSAFANSASGQIIYGIEEQGPRPIRVQDPDSVNPAEITREWIEQVIDSNVQPRIQNLVVQSIDVATGRVAYVITIPQATTYAPHQAPDNNYYCRQNFQSVPMEDYQVRDTMRRATTPELFVELSFASGKEIQLECADHANLSKPITLVASIRNRSPQPAFHVIVQLGIDANLPLRTLGNFVSLKQNWVQWTLQSPPNLPIFKEAEPRRISLTFAFFENLLTSGDHLLYLTTLQVARDMAIKISAC
jgi:Putative DNA-binding domain